MLKKYLVLSLLIISSSNAAGKKEAGSASDAPVYVKLDIDEGIYRGSIHDSDAIIPVTKLSFGGKTTLSGVRKETDNSQNVLKLANITDFEILDPVYESERYPNQEYALVRVRLINKEEEDLLIPRHITICGESTETHIEKAWFLRMLNGFHIQHNTQEPTSKQAVHAVSLQEPDTSTSLDEHEHHDAQALLEELLEGAA